MENIGFEKVIKKNGDVFDTLSLIASVINKHYNDAFIKKIVDKLGPVTDKNVFIRKLFDYYCRNVKYELDSKGTEMVWTPERIIHEGKGDCKKAATFLSCVLKAAGIEPVLKHVYYNDSDSYTHIYVIVPNPDLDHYITLDPTNNCQFDKEVSYKSAVLYFLNGKKMELKYMGAPKNVFNSLPFSEDLGTGCHTMLGDIEGLADNIGGPAHAPVKRDNLKKLVPDKPHLHEATKNIPIQDQRGAFLELIKNNVDGIASHLALALGTNTKGLDEVWKAVGGDINELKKQIILAAKKPPISSDSENISGPEYIGKGFFKKLLHGASVVLHAIAPAVNAIIPGAGGVVDRLADKAEFVSSRIPTRDAQGKIVPPPPLPSDHSGYKDPIPGLNHGNVIGSVGGFIFKSLLIISNLHINSHLAGQLGIIVISTPLLYFCYKKLKTKWNLQNI